MRALDLSLSTIARRIPASVHSSSFTSQAPAESYDEMSQRRRMSARIGLFKRLVQL
ncbi:unnamed protein product [Gongylonema pulchrum]|uniref:Secreted protein n=1 Tax=Gongylonema pulchrum TaxID=637853 RepID=A0A183DEA0_9BILA|nr:unnamed protein product [Gongylonema pulchrum]